ncbi:TauD/TfdA family dioxygenase [Streptomyces chrestomyceticus]|uniref:TauD/TfdA family dioxygenase n=1 Tax=Streptomyces chrestomyceticus TaxID=68185 RepID=UPI0033EB5F62
MEPLDETAARAFDELREAMLAVLDGAVLEAGDLIVVDNRTAVHGRTAFRPRYDGQDRWLRRCFAVADLRPSRAVRTPGSQVCAPLKRAVTADRRAVAPAAGEPAAGSRPPG